MAGADLTGASLNGSRLTSVDLSAVLLAGTDLTGARFEQDDLHERGDHRGEVERLALDRRRPDERDVRRFHPHAQSVIVGEHVVVDDVSRRDDCVHGVLLTRG